MTESNHGGKRPGAGRKVGSTKPDGRNEKKQIRFNERELGEIQAAADIREVSFSEFVRKAALYISSTVRDLALHDELKGGELMKTKCTHCGTVSNNQPAGDGCHACSRGTMQPA